MTTQEDRLAIVERKVAALELRRLYDERKAEENTPSALGVNLREINENMTILLGIASAQEQNIKEIREDVEVIKERIDRVEQRTERIEVTLSEHTVKFDRLETLLTQVLKRLPEPS